MTGASNATTSVVILLLQMNATRNHPRDLSRLSHLHVVAVATEMISKKKKLFSKNISSVHLGKRTPTSKKNNNFQKISDLSFSDIARILKLVVNF